MAIRFILMMALMMIALGDPVPDPDIRVDVNQVVNAGAGCGGGCCGDDCNKNVCDYDGNHNADEVCLIEGCLILCCINGKMKCIGIDSRCEYCRAGGEHGVKTFDDVEGAYQKQSYLTISNGTYVLTQKGLTISTNYQVIGDFSPSPYWPGERNASYYKGITYNYGGNTKKISLTCKDTAVDGWDCTNIEDNSPSSVKIWDITHEVNIYDRNCKGFVGTDGLTVMMCGSAPNEPPNAPPCERDWQNLPYIYIYAPTSLKSTPSSSSGLYGLCNTFTLPTMDGYTQGPYPTNGAGTAGKLWTKCFPAVMNGDETEEFDIDIKCGEFIESWKYP